MTVNLTKNIRSVESEPMELAYSWSFWIKANLYELTAYQLLNTIELREPGEGLLQAYGAYAGDLNNDGYDDVVSANSTGHNVAVLLNDGNGGLLTPTNLTENQANFPLAIDLGDLDGDGDLDLVGSYYSTTNFLVFLYEGIGTVATENVLPFTMMKSIAPNPFSDQMRMELGVDCSDCQLAVYDPMGKLIRILKANQKEIIWDGQTQNGLDAPAGWYCNSKTGSN